MLQGCQPYVPAAFTPQEITLVLISVAGLSGRSPAEIVVSNPTGGMDEVCCECCVLSGRGLCDELITRPEEFYRL